VPVVAGRQRLEHPVRSPAAVAQQDMDVGVEAQELATWVLRNHRDRACEFSPDYPACITNAAWREFESAMPFPLE